MHYVCTVQDPFRGQISLLPIIVLLFLLVARNIIQIKPSLWTNTRKDKKVPEGRHEFLGEDRTLTYLQMIVQL